MSILIDVSVIRGVDVQHAILPTHNTAVDYT